MNRLSLLKLAPSSLKTLSSALETNGTLRSLSVAFNRFGFSGCNFLAEGLRFNLGLTDLNLCGVGMKAPGLLSIVEALTVNRSLVHLK